MHEKVDVKTTTTIIIIMVVMMMIWCLWINFHLYPTLIDKINAKLKLEYLFNSPLNLRPFANLRKCYTEVNILKPFPDNVWCLLFLEFGREKIASCGAYESVLDFMQSSKGNSTQDAVLDLLCNLAENGKF